MLDCDVLVCGGGPAGLAAAVACSMRGMRVIVLEHQPCIIDKACGEGLLPEALSALESIGIPADSLPGIAFRGIRFVDGSSSPVEACFRNSAGRGVRRTALHQALYARAHQAGVDVRSGVCAVGICDAQNTVAVTTTAGALRARSCIGADGISSQVRRWAGLERGLTRSKRIGLRLHLAINHRSEFVEVHWGRTGQVYITPTGISEICIAAVARPRYQSVRAALSEFPELRESLCESSVVSTSKERGAATLTGMLPRVTAGRTALIGDASGSVDAVTGAGLALAFQQALALADALEANDFALYERAHKLIVHRAVLLARLLLQLERFPALRRFTLDSFRRQPNLFEHVLAVHTGAAPLSYWGSGGALTLGLRALLS